MQIRQEPSRAQQITQIRSGEFITTLLAALCFFLIMCGYFMLRPIRETMGLDQRIDDLHWLFLATLGVMIPTSFAFSWLASRLPRRTCIAITFIFVLICLAAFSLALSVYDTHLGPLTGRVFYVWLSVINLLIISAFWACIVDNHTQEQGRRLFAYVGIGGTLGAIVGPLITTFTIEHVGEPVLFCAAFACFAATLAILRFGLFPCFDRRGFVASSDGSHSHRRIGGAAIDGLKHLFSNPRLGLLALYIIAFTILASLLYFEQARLIKAALPDRTDRTQLYGWMSAGSQTTTILLQLFITSRLLTRVGLGPALLSLPVFMLFGFLGLTFTPSIPVFMLIGLLGLTCAPLLLGPITGLFEAAILTPTIGLILLLDIGRNATSHALSKPAREVIFTTVPPEDKYKAKSAIDTFVYRSGDAGGALTDMVVTGGKETATNGPIGIVAGVAACVITLGLIRVAPRRSADS